ncbi:MAG: bacillithiol system redox-active protein YtxJ [Chitinophagia bacterium]|nr:bacillithiol system redox-active protein YtxJ [Chitinophagia bacterium]
MEWISLLEMSQLDDIVTRSHQRLQVIFKHSTRCSVSSMVLNRLEREQAPDDIDFYYLDLLSFRSISNTIADRFQVHHESPQIIVFKNGDVIYDESHMAIQMDEITALV